MCEDGLLGLVLNGSCVTIVYPHIYGQGAKGKHAHEKHCNVNIPGDEDAKMVLGIIIFRRFIAQGALCSTHLQV